MSYTLNDMITLGTKRFVAAGAYCGHGFTTPEDELLALALYMLNLPYDVDQTVLQWVLMPAEQRALEHLLQQRIDQRIPTAYLTNTMCFAGLEFYIDARALIPRSPIAELIQAQFMPWAQQVTRILDLCTGSGCIAIACAHVFPDVPVDASDISSDALAVAALNREKHELTKQVNLIVADLFAGLAQNQYDIIVSNPPYVSVQEMLQVPAEYRYEPQLGLVAEKQGLALVQKILAEAADYLTPQGILIVEVGNAQDALIAALPRMPFCWLEFEHGGSGIFVLTRQQLIEYQ